MKDTGYEHAHSSPIKTPKQLVVVIVLAFAIPVIGIILLTQYIARSHRPDPSAVAPEAVAARIQPLARVEIDESAPRMKEGAAGAPAAAATTTTPVPVPTIPPPQTAQAPSGAANIDALFQKYGCLACHAFDKRLVGPAYKEVAAKYAGDKDALAKLTHKVKGGGAGVWGQVPMPPQAAVPDSDLQAMVKQVLASK